MAAAVSKFLQITGVGAVPSDLAELIPYLITVVVAVCLVSGVFGVIGSLARLFLYGRH